MEFAIRPAYPNDRPYLMDIDSKSYDLPWESDYWNLLGATRSKYVIVATDTKNIPYGFAVYELQGNKLEIVKVAVNPNHRLQGVAADLLNWVMEYAHDRYMTEVYTVVSENNLDAQLFLRAVGLRADVKRTKRGWTHEYGCKYDGWLFAADVPR
jgi:ribosomal protein S18 acetylase RimI-like enzyme